MKTRKKRSIFESQENQEKIIFNFFLICYKYSLIKIKKYMCTKCNFKTNVEYDLCPNCEMEMETVVKERPIVYHRTPKKKNRAKIKLVKSNDYVNNGVLYNKLFDLHFSKKILTKKEKEKTDKFYTIYSTTKKEASTLKNVYNNILYLLSHYNLHDDKVDNALEILKQSIDIDYKQIVKDVIEDEIKALNEKINNLEQSIIDDIKKICIKLTKNYNWKQYGIAEKEDMVSFAMTKILNSKPWEKFNIFRSNSPFSFFTATVFNYFRMFIKDYYAYDGETGIKQKVLKKIICDYDAEWCEYGIQFNLSEGIDFDN